MDKPTIEQMMYANLDVIKAMFKGMKDNLDDTCFDNPDIHDLVRALQIGLIALDVELTRAFESSNEPTRVCF